MKKKRIVIGLTGYIAGGKGFVADILKNEFGFVYYSLSDRVREAVRGYKEITRELMQNTGDEMRIMFGGDILAKVTAGIIWAEHQDRVIIDGIRNPEEYAFLAQHPYFILLAVTALFEMRFARVKLRGRPSDPKTLTEFYAIDERDRGIGQDLLGQQVERCVELADFTLENNGTREAFETQVRDFINLL